MMVSPNPTSPAQSLNISDEVQKKFPDFIDLIKGSQSMNNEERQYWVDVLLIMTEDQLANLKNILLNEKKQLDEAAKGFKAGVEKDEKEVKVYFDELKYKEKKQARAKAEGQFEKDEKEKEADLLKAIQNM